MTRFFTKQNAKRLAFLGAASALVLVLAMLLSAFGPIDIFRLFRFGDFNPFVLLLLLMSGSLTLSIIVGSAAYLDIFSASPTQTSPISEVQDRLLALEKGLAELSQTRDITSVAEAAAKAVYVAQIKSDLEALAKDQLAELAKEELLKENEPAFRRVKTFETLQNVFSPFLRGLRHQSEEQARMANFNVWCGMVFAACGLGVMGYIVYDFSSRVGTNQIADWTQFAFQFLPKFTFVVLFESIAFFFLQLYRDDRGQQRYLRNELTNIEARALALSTAALSDNPALTSEVVTGLLSTERNFTIKKGERLILEALQKEAPILFESIVQKLIPDISKQLQNQKANQPAS